MTQSAVLSRGRRLANMSSRTYRMPVLDMLPLAYFVNGDTGQKKTTKMAWDKKLITAEEIAVIVPIPEAVLDDSNYDIWGEEMCIRDRYNPPKNPNAPVNVWCKKMELRPDAIHKHVDYRDVPVNWIGKKLIESAELLKETDFKLYRWVWLGECIGVDDLIYYMFNKNHRREPEAMYYKLIGIGVDYGQQNATTFQAGGLNIRCV